MRSHVTGSEDPPPGLGFSFNTASGMRSHVTMRESETWCDAIGFQYRKRYEITCDEKADSERTHLLRFNTASGMRSHVTAKRVTTSTIADEFQYRKRYEITCDGNEADHTEMAEAVSIPQAV